MSWSRGSHETTARVLVVAVAVITALGALLADFLIPASAAQHLKNDAWPPHAKFHDAQYVVMSLLLGVIAVGLIARRGRSGRAGVWTACLILATPWLGLLSAGLFPGTAIHDPEFENGSVLGLHPQMFLALVLLALLSAAALLHGSGRNPVER